MEKMWAGRTAGALDKIADDFNSSIHIDSRMYKEDILGSVAHATMLAEEGVISDSDADAIISALSTIADDIDSGELKISPDAEDIHMFIESVLTERVGEVGKRLHTARSRNDQIALDIRLYLKKETDQIDELLAALLESLYNLAEKHKETKP